MCRIFVFYRSSHFCNSGCVYQDAQKFLPDFLSRLLDELEKSSVSTDDLHAVFELIRQSNRDLFATLLTYLAQLSIVLDPTLFRGQLVAKVMPVCGSLIQREKSRFLLLVVIIQHDSCHIYYLRVPLFCDGPSLIFNRSFNVC